MTDRVNFVSPKPLVKKPGWFARGQLSRFRNWILLFIYFLQLVASLWMAYELRFDFRVDERASSERMFVMFWLVPLQLFLLVLFKQFTSNLSYFSTPDLGRIFQALLSSAVLSWVGWFIWGADVAPPRGVIAIDFVLALMGLTGVRLGLRRLRESQVVPKEGKNSRRRRVGIIGAGNAGAVLVHELSLKRGYGLEPVAFFDDAPGKWNTRVHDIPILGNPEKLVESYKKLGIEEAVIAMPSAPARRVREIVALMRTAKLPCRTIPSLDQLAAGHILVSQLRNIEVQDLLGRERVELETESIRKTLQDRIVLVTGAGGSIGSELCRQIVKYKPKQLLLLERSEPNLFQIEQELIGTMTPGSLVPLVADILDRPRMEEIFERYRPQVFFHAAAHKHVPMMEHQPGEAIKNNCLGTAALADLALKYKVDRFTLISTDKAIRPTSVMGATKRLAEIYVQALYAANPDQTKFMAVRFGNVLGSSGSVIPIFRKQIAEGGPITVTDPEMTRYFMTIPEASLLVLQSATQGSGGEIFVLDMGKPIRIVDLARQMIELSGLTPGEDIEIKFTGIRPGEKLYEELCHTSENSTPTTHRSINRFVSEPAKLDQQKIHHERLRASLHKMSPSEHKELLRELVPEYTPDPKSEK